MIQSKSDRDRIRQKAAQKKAKTTKKPKTKKIETGENPKAQGTFHLPIVHPTNSLHGNVVPYNYKQLPPDDPRRIEIEAALANCPPPPPQKRNIETFAQYQDRKRAGR